MKREGKTGASVLLTVLMIVSALATQIPGCQTPSLVHAASLPLGDGESAHLRLSSSSYSPTRVFPGDEDVEVTVVVVNTGDETADNSRAKIGFPEGFAPSYEGSGVVNLGSISEGGTSTFTFSLDVSDSVESKTYELKLYLEWHGGENTEEIPIRISDKAHFKIVSVETSSMRIEPGAASVKITIMLKNEGDVDAEEVAARLKGSVFSVTTIIFLGTIYAGQTVPAIFEVDIDSSAPTGTVDGQLNLSWLQKGRTIDETLTFPLTIYPPLIPWYGWVGLAAIAALVIYRFRDRLTRSRRERKDR